MPNLPSPRVMRRAFLAGDASYDGVFFTGVKTTGIFCRPSCTARKPRPENVEFFATPREAVFSGYRACKRCHPLDTDGRPPAWDESYEWLLVETVRHDPRWYGLEQSLWTCELLAGYLAEHTGTKLSAERVRVLLHQHGIHLKQPIPVVHSRDPQYDPKGSRRRRSATPTNRP